MAFWELYDSYFEKGCRRNCARDNPERQGVMVSWYTYKSHYPSLSYVYTTVTAKPKTSRQNQKRHGQTKNPHGKKKIPHDKTKNLTAKTKYLTAKPKTSRQNQILHSKNKIALVLPWVFAFAVRYLVFAVKYLVLPWGILFQFCREAFGFAVTVVDHRICPTPLLEVIYSPATRPIYIPLTLPPFLSFPKKKWKEVQQLLCNHCNGSKVMNQSEMAFR